MTTAARVRLVTINAGLLHRVAGLLEPAPFVEERARALGPALRALAPTLVALQEVYDRAHRQLIAASLAPICPHVVHRSGHRLLDSGLVALGRDPMKAELVRFHAGPRHERLLASRAVLVVTVETPEGALTVLNVHATAGALFSHPESVDIEALRARQMRELLQLAEQIGGPAVIAGDLNAGPEASPANFRQLLDAGWNDTGEGHIGPTWEPQNPLNVRGPHRTSPPQRIDHVLVRERDLRSGRIGVATPSLVLREPVVAAGHRLVTPSDHYGIMIDLIFRSGA